MIWTLAALSMLAAAPGACPGYALSLVQDEGLEYDPASPVDERVSLRISSSAGALDADCEDTPVIIEPAPTEPTPIRLRNGASALTTSLVSSGVVTRSGRSLVLTASARAELVQGRSVTVPLADIEGGQFRRAGAYTTQLEVSAGDTVQPFTVETVVQPVMRFEAASAGGAQSMDLGELTDGSVTRTSFFYRTNADLAVTAASENGGRLIHEDGPSVGSASYRVFVAGEELDVTTGAAPVHLPFSRLTVQSQTLEVRVPPHRRLYAGRYWDTLTLTFTPY